MISFNNLIKIVFTPIIVKFIVKTCIFLKSRSGAKRAVSFRERAYVPTFLRAFSKLRVHHSVADDLQELASL